MTQTQEKIDTFFKQFPTSTYPAEHILVSAGSPLHYFYFIENGAVKMTRVTASGKNIILHTFFPQSFFSLLSLVTNATNTYDFITLTSTTVRKVPHAELTAFLKKNADVSFELNLRLLKGLNGLLNRIEQTSLTPAINQVANLLIYFSAHYSPGTATTPERSLTIKITHQEIADWLGLSRENVSLQMKKLERAEIIQTQNRFLKITKIGELRKLAEASEIA